MAANQTSFKKGRARTGGRKPGTPNAITKEVRSALAQVLEPYLYGEGIGEKQYKLIDDLCHMEPEDRAKIVSGLVPYVIPKLQSVEVKDKLAAKTYKDELDELDDN